MSSARLEQGNDCAVETSSICKPQTHLLVRDGALHQDTSNYLTVTKFGLGPQMGGRHQEILAD
jgi:hypothetical protein